jgi:hypothetical protein
LCNGGSEGAAGNVAFTALSQAVHRKWACFDLESTDVLCVQKCNAVGWCIMLAELDVRRSSVDMKLRYCKERLYSSLWAFQCQFIQTYLFLVIKENISLNWMFSVDAHFCHSDTELCSVIHRTYENTD